MLVSQQEGPEGQRNKLERNACGNKAHLELGEEHMQEGSTCRRGVHAGGEYMQEGSACRKGVHAGGEHMQEGSACRKHTRKKKRPATTR